MEFWLAIAISMIGGAFIGCFATSVYYTYTNPKAEDDYWDEGE